MVLEDPDLMMDLPLDVIVEATGNTTAGAVHTLSALKNGKHVVMITKETEIVVGPVLRRMARRAGLVYTGADGDQPALLIALIDWCRHLRLILASLPHDHGNAFERGYICGYRFNCGDGAESDGFTSVALTRQTRRRIRA